jgi:hypothetical protein
VTGVGYYVCACIDGDECMLAHIMTLPAALERARQELARTPRADISVAHAGGKFVALTERGTLRVLP